MAITSQEEVEQRIRDARDKGVTRLDLSHLYMEQLPAAIGELVDLEVLSLGENDLHDLPSEIGRLTSLRELDLSGNYLSELPSELLALPLLRGLSLAGNQLNRSLPVELGRTSAEIPWGDLASRCTVPHEFRVRRLSLRDPTA